MVRAIEALPVVTVLSPLAASSKNKPGFRVGLRCFLCQEYGSCGQQEAGPVRITNTCTTLLACLQELHKQIVDGHCCRLVCHQLLKYSRCVLGRRYAHPLCYASIYGTPTHFATQAYICWCNACSRVRGRGYRTVASGWGSLVMPGCTRSTQTLWKEGRFTVVAAAGIKQRKERVAEMLAKYMYIYICVYICISGYMCVCIYI